MKVIKNSNILNNEFVQDPMDMSEICGSNYSKVIITDTRCQLTPSNLEKMLLIYCNSNYHIY